MLSAELLFYTIPASSLWKDTAYNTDKVYYEEDLINEANYTWYTATASTQGSSYSICPRNWRLPSNAEYSTLLSSAGIGSSSDGRFKIQNAPYDFPSAGLVANGSLKNVSSEGHYWTSTASSSEYACDLRFGSDYVLASTRNYRYFGFSIRCIAP